MLPEEKKSQRYWYYNKINTKLFNLKLHRRNKIIIRGTFKIYQRDAWSIINSELCLNKVNTININIKHNNMTILDPRTYVQFLTTATLIW